MVNSWIRAALSSMAILGGASWSPASALQVVACGEVEAYCFGDQGDCPCEGEYDLGGCANATGVGGILSATGHGVIDADNLTFLVRQLPAKAPTIFFTSKTPHRLPFLNGLLCLDPQGTKILRLGAPALASTDGMIANGPGVVSYINDVIGPPAGIVLPGSSWYFQAYYRDLGHCVASANTTNAVRVQFAPPVPQGVTRIGGRVFYDLDKGGSFDVGAPGEVGIEGWKVALNSGASSTFVYTDALGRFQFDVPRDGAEHTLISIPPPPGYVPAPGGTRVATGPIETLLNADVPEICIDMGQFVLENRPDFARSPGFWTNQGEDLLRDCDPEWRALVNGLCLRTNVTNPNGNAGTLFSVSMTAPFEEAFAELGEYLSLPTNGVLAYTLSRHYCAANLNRYCGPLQGLSAFVDRFEDGVLVPFEIMSMQTQGLLCDPCAANTGPQGDQECRDRINDCLNEWDGINSDGSSIWARSDQIDFFITNY